MSGNVRLTAKQEKALLTLLVEPAVQAAAKVVGVSDRTLFRWLKDPAFAEAYRQARREAVSHAIGRLQQVTSDAVDTLKAVATDIEAPAPARVSAAKAVLDLAVKAMELEDLESRIKALEEKTHVNQATPRTA